MHRESQYKVFVGRKEEIKDFERLLSNINIGMGPCILCLYGFGGIGKSTLIRKLREIASEKGVRVLPKHGGVVSKSITSFLIESFRIPTATKRSVGISKFIVVTYEKSYEFDRENIWSKFLQRIKSESVVFIDTTVDVDMEELTTFINFINSSLMYHEAKKLLIIIATRELPHFQEGAYVRATKLDGLNAHDVRELIKAKGWTWVNPDDSQMLLEKAASGNPWIIELICSDQSNWEIFKHEKREITRVETFLTRMWETWGTEEKDAITKLSAIALFSPAWEENACKCIIDSWYDIRPRLKNKAILGERFEKNFRVFTIHDLLRDFAYTRLPGKEKETVHRKLGEYYEGKDPVVSLRHYVECDHLTGIKKVYDDACGRMEKVGEYREIFGRSNRILSSFEESLDEALKARLLVNCGNCLKTFSYQDIYNALPYYEKAKVIYEKLGEASAYAKTLATTGKVLRFVGNLKKSLEALEGAKTILEKKKAEEGVYAWTLRQRAHVYRQLGRLNEALVGYETAKSIYSALKEEEACAWSLYGIGATQLLLGNFEEALGHLLAAKSIFEKGKKHGERVHLIPIAEIYRLKEDYDVAEAYYKDYLEYSSTSKDERGVADALLGLAEVKRLKQKACSEDYSEPLKIYDNIGCKWGVVSTLIGRGLTQVVHNWPEAEKDLKRAEEICEGLSFEAELELIRKIYGERDPKEVHPLNFP